MMKAKTKQGTESSVQTWHNFQIPSCCVWYINRCAIIDAFKYSHNYKFYISISNFNTVVKLFRTEMECSLKIGITYVYNPYIWSWNDIQLKFDDSNVIIQYMYSHSSSTDESLFNTSIRLCLVQLTRFSNFIEPLFESFLSPFHVLSALSEYFWALLLPTFGPFLWPIAI